MDSISYDMEELLRMMTYEDDIFNDNEITEISTHEQTTRLLQATQPSTQVSLHDFEDSKPDTIIQVLRIFVCVVGLIGNFLVIFVILVLAEYKKSIAHWYVLQLAIADSLLLMTIPFRVVEDMNGAWTFAPWLCKAKETILFLNYYSSVLFLTVLSIDRCIAVCCTSSGFLQKCRTRFSAYATSAVVWMIALCMCIPVMLYSGVFGISPLCRCQYEFPRDNLDFARICKQEGYTSPSEFEHCVEIQKKYDEPGCSEESFDHDYVTGSGKDHLKIDHLYTYLDYEDLPSKEEIQRVFQSSQEDTNSGSINLGCHYHDQPSGFKSFIMFNFSGMFLVPFFIMATCYIMIVFRLSQNGSQAKDIDSKESRPAENGRQGRRSTSGVIVTGGGNRIRVTVMSACLVIAFLVCWLPFHAVHLSKMQGMEGSTKFCSDILLAASLLAYTNSAINPYLYNFIGTKFGKRLRSAIGFGKCGNKSAQKDRNKFQTESECKSGTVATKLLKGNDGMTEESPKQEERQRFFHDEVQNQPENIEMQVPTTPISPPPEYETYKNEV